MVLGRHIYISHRIVYIIIIRGIIRRLPRSSGCYGTWVAGQLGLSVPQDEDESRGEDISAGKEVRVLGTRPIFDRTVSSRDQTGLNGDTDNTTDLEDDIGKRAANTGKLDGEGLDDASVHANEDDHTTGSSDDLVNRQL